MGNMQQKFGKDRTCISGDMLADRQAHRDMVVTILRSPIGGRVMNDKGDDVPYVCNMCYILFLFLLHRLPSSCFDLLLAFSFLVSSVCLQCFDAVGWTSGRASGL